MFDVMIGHELSRWAENSLEEWVEAVEEARLLPELQIEIDLSAAGQVVLSPNQSEILETFDSFIEGVESLASTFSSIEPELFPQPEIPEEHLFALDSELVMSSKERLRRVLLEDLQEALKVVDAYSAYEELIAELTPPESAEEVDLNIVRDFLSQCAQRLEEVGRVCPGGIQTRLFFVDTSIATRKLSAMISQASTDCLLAMSQELQRNTEDIRDAYRSLDKHFNTPENDYEAERLLRMVENIDKQTLDPLEARISQLVEVLDFLDTSMFLISLDLRVEIYDLRTKAPDVRTDFRLLCEELKLIFEPPAEDEESDE
ncbi:hypothetical protein Pmar_PMAR011706 [Perkinsus marinus ATCC 50983]|uniref:Uncharacterized protein n=1 Tax=Perkinsus marinus (strain ATCC 50983 / TXsc) TaxID=423536 RepID=C5LCH9_PERM5|nr:hypothetical protein Pmar_PMAR011706 [Perkinsus marinus ATCC 50983]EER05662.1 hypothetical protein Pmar_PMAR011706 [Perkinsus marinus ATCC 50983]|eukprot:XP_002773846.1 hypothetical protein Pmar_PMAR011706 [Perkinsus marinus ATCC 50983]